MPESLGRFEPWLKRLIVLAAVTVLATIVGLGLLGRGVWWPHSGWSRALWATTLAYGGLTYAAFVWRVCLWWRYRPMPPAPLSDLPSVCIVIPAYNEGSLVRHAIASAARSDYPADRLEIIAVDDGSTDDTWVHILSAARAVRPDLRIRTLRQPRNTGKRLALARGFAAARGDVFVTMDSDSVVAPNALRSLVTPLVRDRRIGCVAGCVRVLNPRQGILTRFLKCTFSLSFRFVRAYQNEFRGVFCTPGALSAYRADVVRRVLDEWLDQRFLGLPCVTGEDRALTNLFLRDGWLTAYQGDAEVFARMPHTFGGVTAMFLRWARSNIRETMILYRFLFTRFRQRHLTAFRFNMILAALSLILPPIMIAGGLYLAATQDGYFVRHVGLVILYALTVSAIYYRNERDGDWVWLLAYQFFWVACLSWIIPYAALTLRNTGWLTRGNPEAARDSTSDRSGLAAAPDAMTCPSPA